MTVGSDAAAARVLRKHSSGTPRAAVRPNYVGLPLVGWTRGGRTRAKACGIGGQQAPVRPRKHGPRGAKSPLVERREAGVPRMGRTPQGEAIWLRLATLRSLTWGRG